MKNIGIVTTWFERGAAYVSKQYRDVLTDNFNVYIYARGGEKYARGDENWDGKNVTWAKNMVLPTPIDIDKSDFSNWIKLNNIEIILFNEQQWWFPILWAKELGVVAGAYVDYYTEETVKLFEAYDFLICNTKRHYEIFSWHKNAYYIPWGTDIDLFFTESHSFVNPDFVTFFHSAGMSPNRKGTDTLLEAFDKVNGAKKLIIHSQVDIQKKLPIQSLLIQKLIKSNELEVIYKTVAAPGLYHLGDVYVYPTILDGIGLTIAEAISSGLPTIVPDNQPMNEFIDDSSGKVVKIERLYSRWDGYFWPQCKVSSQHLTQKIQWYINNKANLEEYKKNARLYAEKNLNWKQNSVDLISIFSNIKPINGFNNELIFDYEKRRASKNWIIKIYNKFPAMYYFIIFSHKLLKKVFK